MVNLKRALFCIQLRVYVGFPSFLLRVMKHKTPLFSRSRFILSWDLSKTHFLSTLFNFLSRNKSSHIKQPKKKIFFLSLFSLFHSSLPLSLFSHPSENKLFLLHILLRVLLAERIKHASTTSRTSTTTNNYQHTKFPRHHLKSTENLRRSSPSIFAIFIWFVLPSRYIHKHVFSYLARSIREHNK